METVSNDDNDVFQAIINEMIILKDFCQFTKEFKTAVLNNDNYFFQLSYMPVIQALAEDRLQFPCF